MRDSLAAFPDVPGFSAFAYYGQCARNSITGLSVGWADWYAAFLPGQDLDVTGLPNGRYCLTSTADPRDGIDEADETNNARSRLLRLTRRRGRGPRRRLLTGRPATRDRVRTSS